MLLSQVFLQSVVIILPLFPVCFLVVWNLKRLKKAKRNPFNEEELIRHPGQSLLEKLEDINEVLTSNVIGMVAWPLSFALVYYLQFDKLQEGWRVYAIMVTFSLLGTLYFGSRAQKTLNTLRDYRLGYQGELYVAQKLEYLLSKGYQVFHDVVFKNFNIDHVLVGPTGVYVIETKAKRKWNDYPNGHSLEYDGRKLSFSDGSFDTAPLEQVKRNAETLGKILKEKAEESIPVYPILAYPGWNIKRTGKSAINVINPKEISNALSFFPNANLDTKKIKIIHLVLANIRKPN